jgi:hypothetical protein
MKLKYLIICFLLINLYGFEGIKLYKNGEYKKAEQFFSKYIKETNSSVAKAYLAKIYYKEKKYKKSVKLINELLKDKSVPSKVKKELKNYLDLAKGVKWLKAEIAAGVLYDSNVKNDKSKTKDVAHIEEALIKGYYLKNNFETSFDFKVQNRGYIKYDENNYVYIDTNAYLTYYSFINSRIKIGFETKTTNQNYLYKSELYFFKNFNSFETGIFAIGDYYKYDDLNAKNLGGGVRFGLLKDKFKIILSLLSYYSNFDNKNLNKTSDETNNQSNGSNLLLMSYYSNVENKNLDNRNYKVDIKTNWNFLDVYLFIDYYYNIAKFDNYRNNIHYLDVSLATSDIKHLFYSIGITQYYSFNNSLKQDNRKYEVYAKFIFYF